MPRIDPVAVQRLAESNGFRPDVVEQILHLKNLLQLIADDPVLSSRLVLIGGTAINLFTPTVPRLSVDIDMDYAKPVREVFDQKSVKQHLNLLGRLGNALGMKYFKLSRDGEDGHGRLRVIFEYKSDFGREAGTVKIDISYLMKCMVFQPKRRKMSTLGSEDPFTDLRVLASDPCELWAGKALALVYKAKNDPQPEDVADLYSMEIARHLFDVARLETCLRNKSRFLDQQKLRKAFVLKGVPRVKQLFFLSGEGIRHCSAHEVKQQLDPYLRQSDESPSGAVRPPLDEMKTLGKEFLFRVCSNRWSLGEKKFVELFQKKGEFRPDLLFGKGSREYSRISANQYLHEAARGMAR